jgi:hypothetical protein
MMNLPHSPSSQNSRSNVSNLAHLPCPHRSVHTIRATFSCAWQLNAALLVAAIAWIFCDGRSLGHIESLERWLGITPPLASTRVLSPYRAIPIPPAAVGLALAGLTLLVMFSSLFIGNSRYRTTRCWLLFMGVVCGWLGTLTAWPEIYWRGQQHRVQGNLEAAANLVETVTANWPATDGEIAGVGAFLAYPQQAPATLLMLVDGTSPRAAFQFSAIERSMDGTLRLELAGSETGAWLEWRPDETRPRSFVGGLQTNYELCQWKQLAPGWYLVRYRASAAITHETEPDSGAR